MTFWYFPFLTDILLHSAFGIFDSECGRSLSCFRCMSQNKLPHILLLSMSQPPPPKKKKKQQQQQLLLKIDRYKDGCHLKHILGGRRVCLFVSLSVSYS